jgi:hypothetical protein
MSIALLSRSGSIRGAGAVAVALTLAAWPVHTLAAQSPTPIDGPPPPVSPSVIRRDATGRATVRAIKLSAPLVLDGILDEDVYSREAPFDGLIQVAPNDGAPATERSDIWITYDDRNIYLSCRCHESAPPAEWVVNELRRDTNGLRNNEHIGVLFDTFYDRRSGFAFYTNPLGARADYSVVDEGGSNTDWNPVWTSKSGRFDGGWTVEMAIPFKSLRYRAGKDQIWGMQIRRSVRHKNEWDYLTPVPRILAGPQALNRVSAGGTLVGLDLPEAGKNIELKPYVVTRSAVDRVRAPQDNYVFTSEIGGDVKYAVTPNLTADLTVNTDFAQVEIDEQQVNLTRFSLFFPEKREFFLEGRGIFDFGRGGERCAEQQQWLGYAGSVLHAPHRPQWRQCDPDQCGRSTDGQTGTVCHRPDEHRHGARCTVPLRSNQLHRGSAQARHSQTQFHRHDGHESVGGHLRYRVERRVWHGWRILAVTGAHGRCVLGTDQHDRRQRQQPELSGARRLRTRSLRCEGGISVGGPQL